MTQTLNIKPLSVNAAYRGKRYKSQKYKDFEREVMYSLKAGKIEGLIHVDYEFGVSNKLADVDNCIKVTQDLMQKKYSFNDHQIMSFTACKKIVEKGSEYIKFSITQL